MLIVSDDSWTLLAKYLFDEAEPEECRLVEAVLQKDTQLNDFYRQIQAMYFIMEKGAMEGSTLESAGIEGSERRAASGAFAKLSARIKAQNGNLNNL